MATKVSNGLDLQNQKVVNLASPSTGTDAANKAYVDSLAAGLEWKQEVRAATTTNGTLSSAFASGQVVDGYTLVTNDRLLLKNQTNQPDNGIYIVNSSGAPTRVSDANTTASLNNATVLVTKGTVNADTAWTQTTADPTVGTSNIVFVQFGASVTYSAGNGLQLVGTTFSVLANGASITVGPSGISTSAAAIGATTKYAASIGDGSTTAIVVTHNLGTLDVEIQLFDNSTGQTWLPDVSSRTTNAFTLNFGTAPTSSQLRVVVIG